MALTSLYYILHGPSNPLGTEVGGGFTIADPTLVSFFIVFNQGV